MNVRMQVTLSNRLENLYEAFKHELYQLGDALALERLVIVPNSAIRDWLQQRLAADPEIGLAAGLRFAFEDDAFACLVLSSEQLFPSHMQVSFALEGDLIQLIQQPTKDLVWQPLFDYLGTSPGSALAGKTQQRLVALCDQLALLFLDYGKQAGRIVAPRSTQAFDWQKRLWQRLFALYPHWSYPYQHTEPLAQQPERRIYLFGQVYLCPLYHRFFLQLAKQCSVQAFFFSACAEYWADIRSDRESAQLLRFQQKQGVSLAQQQALDELLRDRNPLLANLGKVGRKMAAQLDWDDQELDCAHQAPEVVSILTRLHTDLLHLNNQSYPSPCDSSIQVHISPNRHREIEALHDTLKDLMHAHAIVPLEVQVLAPDIELYVPHIKAVFGAEETLRYQLADLSVFVHDTFTDGFRRLLALPHSRWEAPSVLEFLECAPVCQRYGLTDANLQQIRSWVQQAGIIWGISPQHRAEILKNAHCLQEPVSDQPAGTWNEGLGRLLHGLVYGSESIEHRILPVLSVSWTQSDLLAKFVELIDQLQSDLRPLEDGTRKTPAEWAAYLMKLCSNHLRGSNERLLSLINEFSLVNRPLVPFTSIRKRLERVLKSKRYIQRDSDGQAVRFGSIRFSSGIPAKVVCLIGLDEGAFPLSEANSPLNLLAKNSLADDVPSPLEQDRQRFLDGILSARQHLILSYTGIDTKDGREQNPSNLITELTTYLERAYGVLPEAISVRHPFYPFDKEKFSNTNLQTDVRYKAAKAYYCEDKRRPHSFFSTFSNLPQASSEEPTIELKDLEMAARNPLQIYCNRSLGLYLQEEESLRADEPFVLSALGRYKIKEEAKESSLEVALKRASAKTILPTGVFGAVAANQLRQEFQSILHHVNPEELFSVEFGLHTTEPVQQRPNQWLLPAVPVTAGEQTLLLCGRLNNLSPKGWLFNGKGDLEAQIKAWPGSLLLNYIPSSILPSKTILWAKNSKATSVPESTESHLKLFVEYTLACKKSPSPLIPEWIPAIIAGDPDKIRKKLEDKRFFNQYAKWACRDVLSLFDKPTLTYWGGVAKSLYLLDSMH